MKFILPEHQSLSPQNKAEIQNRILTQVYDSTYPLGDIDKARLEIESGIQRILFWSKSIKLLEGGYGGTLALIKDASKSESTVEMCRAGSTMDIGGGIQAVSMLFEEFLKSQENQIFATPRNCLERMNSKGEIIPGGKTISLIYSRLKNIQYWGIAPWYIMPGDSLELLDLRIFTKNDLCRSLINNGKKVYIHSENNRRIFYDIISRNYNIESSTFDCGTPNNNLFISPSLKLNIKYCTNHLLRKYNYTLCNISKNGEINLNQLKKTIDEIGSGVDIIKINTFDENLLSLQELIETQGFKMVSLFPERDELMGYWFRSNNKNYALPYYWVESTKYNDTSAIDTQKQIIQSILG